VEQISVENQERIAEIKEKLKWIDERSDWDKREYEEELDECYDAKSLVETYGASKILEKVDPIAYSVGLGEFWGNRRYELKEELEGLGGSED